MKDGKISGLLSKSRNQKEIEKEEQELIDEKKLLEELESEKSTLEKIDKKLKANNKSVKEEDISS